MSCPYARTVPRAQWRANVPLRNRKPVAGCIPWPRAGIQRMEGVLSRIAGSHGGPIPQVPTDGPEGRGTRREIFGGAGAGSGTARREGLAHAAGSGMRHRRISDSLPCLEAVMRFVKERVSQNRKKMEKLRDSAQHTRHRGVDGAEGNKGAAIPQRRDSGAGAMQTGWPGGSGGG